MISAQQLHAAYGRKKEVFNGLNLQLHGGNISGLLGKNGAGKSTLLRLFYGLIYPRKGDLKVFGYTPAQRKPSFLRQVFMVPEEFYLPNIRITELLRYHSVFYPGFNSGQFKKHLADFEIPDSQRLQQMSYGQKKKVIISLGLASNTPLLLMDEPTNGLDIISKSQFRKTVSGLPVQNRCVIISTHQVKDLENLIDRVLIIDDARIIFDQTIETVGRKLTFNIAETGEPPENTLFHEPSINGTAVVTPNSGGNDSKTDLELLYKAVMHNPSSIQKIFSA